MIPPCYQRVGSKSDRRVNMSWRAFDLPASKTSRYKISTRTDPTILTRPDDISAFHIDYKIYIVGVISTRSEFWLVFHISKDLYFESFGSMFQNVCRLQPLSLWSELYYVALTGHPHDGFYD